MKTAKNPAFRHFFRKKFYEICLSKTSLRLSFFSSLALSIRHDNSSTPRIIVEDSSSDGQRNRPRSKRLKYSQNPSPSHSRIFILFLLLLQKTNSVSVNGSSEKLSCTNIINPLMDFLISVYPQHRYTGLSFHLIIATSTPCRFPLEVPYLSHCLQ